ncbi:MAG: zinc ribbon domain-containing protein [Bacillota bacterium]|nr:zinc ribbon domain-containing protein [Bacillota bacterium]
MPLYDMRCRQCGKEFTIMASWQEKENATCPRCGSNQVEQLYRSFALGKGTSGGGGCSPAPGRSFG